jgi:hypothetical protein
MGTYRCRCNESNLATLQRREPLPSRFVNTTCNSRTSPRGFHKRPCSVSGSNDNASEEGYTQDYWAFWTFLKPRIPDDGHSKRKCSNNGCCTPWPRGNPLSAKVGTNFADKWRSLGRFSSHADSDHGVLVFFRQHYITEGKISITVVMGLSNPVTHFHIMSEQGNSFRRHDIGGHCPSVSETTLCGCLLDRTIQSCGLHQSCNHGMMRRSILIVRWTKIRGAIQKFPKYINNNYYVLPGSYSVPFGAHTRIPAFLPLLKCILEVFLC